MEGTKRPEKLFGRRERWALKDETEIGRAGVGKWEGL